MIYKIYQNIMGLISAAILIAMATGSVFYVGILIGKYLL